MERLANIAAQLAPQPCAGGAGPKPKVAVLGAAGGIGQPLALLLKASPLIGELSLYDVMNTPGVAADLSHISTGAKVTGHLGPQQLDAALQGCHLVFIPAGVPRKPGMTRDDLFNINASIVKTLCEGIARACPHAFVAIISNPVNSTVPIAAEVFKRAGTYNPAKLFGVTTLDVVRAETFVAEIAGVDPTTVHVPVVGGHAGITILPLLSQARPQLPLEPTRAKALMARIQDAGTEVVQAKAGTGSATLSMAYAAARFGESCLKALAGQPGVLEYSFVQSSVVPGLPFFSSRIRLGRNGVEEFLPLGSMNALEKENFAALHEELSASIKKGVDFVNKANRGIKVRAMSADEVIAVTQRLLDCIAGGDYETYKTLCAEDLTCFEPESVGHQVAGLSFHKYYFDNIDFSASATSQGLGKPINLNTMVAPKVRLYGDAAVISYVRLTQKGGASPVTAQAQETRVWEKRNGSWKLVHFHKSV